jgi:hypothetical protein
MGSVYISINRLGKYFGHYKYNRCSDMYASVLMHFIFVFQRKHPSMYLKSPKVEMNGPNGPTTSDSPKEPKYKKSKLESLVHQMTSQPKVNALVFNFMVDDVQSLSVLEQPAFRKLIEGLSGGKMSMTRNTFINRIEMAFSKMKDKLKENLDSVQSVCTTADIWTAHNRSYIGMTCHWIEKNELVRKSAALACARIRGSHTFETICSQNTRDSFGLQY